MNGMLLLDALGNIDDKYIADACAHLGCIPNRMCNEAADVTKRRRLRRRGFSLLVAATVVVLSILATAFAVSGEFRAMVFEFLHIPAFENVPDSGSFAENEIGGIIGNRVHVKYIDSDTEVYFTGTDILYQRICVENGDLIGVRFFTVGENGLSVLTTYTTHFEIYGENGIEEGVVFWCATENGFAVTGEGWLSDGKSSWEASVIDGIRDTVLISVRGGIQNGFEFSAWLLDLESGEMNGVNIVGIRHVQQFTLTPGLDNALVFGRMDGDTQTIPYICNLQSGEMMSLAELTGNSGGDITARIVDGDTVVLKCETDEVFSAWAYSIRSGKIVRTADQIPIMGESGQGGIVDFGARYAFFVNADLSTAVIDLKTGSMSAAISGFAFDRNAEMLVNGSGRGACYYVCSQEQNSLGVTALGMVDFEKVEFIVFDREGIDKIKETSLGWIGENRVFISVDREFLYIYEFQ